MKKELEVKKEPEEKKELEADCESTFVGCIFNCWESCGNINPSEVCRRMGITREFFLNDTLRRIYELALAYDAEAEKPNLMGFVEFLKKDAPREKQTLMPSVYKAYDEKDAFSISLEHYADVLKNRRDTRTLLGILHKYEEILKLCNRDNNFVSAVGVNDLTEDLMNAFPPAGHVVDIQEATHLAAANLRDIVEKGAAAMKGLPTGYPRLDDILFGLKSGEMIVLAARPSVGKTTLAMNIAQSVVEQGKGVLVFSLEMGKEALMQRMLCGEAKVDLTQAQSNLLTAAQRKEITAKIDAAEKKFFDAQRLYIEDTNISEISQLRAQARALRRRKAIELVVIDYLQQLNCEAAARLGRQLEVARISGEIKKMARELKIPVLVLSQLSRDVEKSGDKDEKPRLSDLRDSGAIEQDADVVMFLRRPSKALAKEINSLVPKDVICIDVAKNRNGVTRETVLEFQGKFYRFAALRDEEHDALIQDGRLVDHLKRREISFVGLG